MTELRWRRSSRSGAGGGTNDCVEVAKAAGVAWVRDSKQPAGNILRFGDSEFAEFLAKAGR